MRSGGRAGRQHHLDLRHGGGVEGRAERGEERQDLGRGVGLHRVEDAAVRQHAARRSRNCGARRRGRRRGRGRRVVARRGTSGCGPSSSGESPVPKRFSPGVPASTRRPRWKRVDVPGSPHPARRPGGSRRTARSRRTEVLTWSHRLERESPFRTSGNESVCLFSVAGLWRADRDQKSPPPSLL